MEQEIKIKGHVFGPDKPVICVPVTEETEQEIRAEIERLVKHGVTMIEWRMDWYEGACDSKKAAEVLYSVQKLLKSTVLLCTFRSKRQGGQRMLSEEAYQKLLLAAAETGAADCVDLEFFEQKEPAGMIDALHNAGAKVIASHHNFEMTPETAVMTEQLLGMHRAGADICKLAVMPGSKRDALKLMDAVLLTKEAAPESHLAAMSMSEKGVLTRIAGEWYGSEITFASLGRSSAPGQLAYDAQERLLEEIHNSLKGLPK